MGENIRKPNTSYKYLKDKDLETIYDEVNILLESLKALKRRLCSRKHYYEKVKQGFYVQEDDDSEDESEEIEEVKENISVEVKKPFIVHFD
tara:strand:- start:440 stop:712 length:273 start_codon:yes stop_codon:yes gene_type:complete